MIVAELTIKGTPGSKIDDIVDRAISIANLLQVRVLFHFNGNLWYADPSDYPFTVFERHGPARIRT